MSSWTVAGREWPRYLPLNWWEKKDEAREPLRFPEQSEEGWYCSPHKHAHCAYIRMYAWVHTDMQAHTWAHTQMYVCEHTCVHSATYIHKHLNVCPCIHISYMHAQRHMYSHMFTEAHMYAHHTHMHRGTPTYTLISWPLVLFPFLSTQCYNGLLHWPRLYRSTKAWAC